MREHPVKSIRTQLNLKQSDIANLLGVTTGYVSHWETGTRSIPSEAIEALAKKVKVSHPELSKKISSWEDWNANRIAKQIKLKVELASL